MLTVATLKHRDPLTYYTKDDYYRDLSDRLEANNAVQSEDKYEINFGGNLARHAGLTSATLDVKAVQMRIREIIQQGVVHKVGPENTEQVLKVKKGKDDRVPGWDLTFSAPKSVSVLWSQVNLTLRKDIEGLHQEAVAQAMRFVEQYVALTRRGKQGEQVERVAGLLTVEYLHYTSRALKDKVPDPQLHTHTLIANLCSRFDGSIGTLWGRQFGLWKKAVGNYYMVAFARLLQERMGLTIEVAPTSFKIVGVPSKLERFFSKRRVKIEALLAREKWSSSIAAQKAALITRDKETVVDRRQCFEPWQQDGKRFQFGPEQADALIAKGKHYRLDSEHSMLIPSIGEDQRRLYGFEHNNKLYFTDRIKVVLKLKDNPDYPGRLLFLDVPQDVFQYASRPVQRQELFGLGVKQHFHIPHHEPASDFRRVMDMGSVLRQLTETRAYFTEQDVWYLVARESIAKQGTQGIRKDVERIMSHPQLRVFNKPVISHKKGKYKIAETVYSTEEMYQMEQTLVTQAKRRAQSTEQALHSARLKAATCWVEKQSGGTLTPEQRQAVLHCASKDLSVVITTPRSGSGLVASVLHKAYFDAGYQVLGVGANGRVARLLEEPTGIKSESIYAFLPKLQSGQIKLTAKHVLVVDEAGFIGTRQHAHLMHWAENAKIVMFGDFFQAQPGAAGGIFSELAKTTAAVSLSNNFTMQRPGDGVAKHIRAEQVLDALEAMRKQDCLHIIDKRLDMLSRIIDDYLDDVQQRGQGKQCILCTTRQEAEDINGAVRRRMKMNGLLQNPVLIRHREDRFELAEGDRIIFQKNSVLLGLQVGDVGQVQRITFIRDKPFVAVRLDNGTKTQFSLHDYFQLSHAYALPPARAQVETFDKSFVLLGEKRDLETLYVQLTRHRQAVAVYVDKPSLKEFLNRLRPSEKMIAYAKDIAHNQGLTLPDDYQKSFQSMRQFLNQAGTREVEYKDHATELMDLAEQIHVSRKKGTLLTLNPSEQRWDPCTFADFLKKNRNQALMPTETMLQEVEQMAFKHRKPLPRDFETSYVKTLIFADHNKPTREDSKQAYPVLRDTWIQVAEENDKRALWLAEHRPDEATLCRHDAQLMAGYIGQCDHRFDMDNPFERKSLRSAWQDKMGFKPKQTAQFKMS